jgi:prepilin-type N-terminal cleavage/methylation domain-containing protein
MDITVVRGGGTIIYYFKSIKKEKEKKTMKKTNKGFSLVELIIVIAIMAILAGAIAPALIKYIDKSRKSNDVSSAKTIKTAIETALGNETAYEELVCDADTVIIFEPGSVSLALSSSDNGSGSDTGAVDITPGDETVTDTDKAHDLIVDSLSQSVPKIKFKKKGATEFVAVVDSLGVVTVGVSDDDGISGVDDWGDTGSEATDADEFPIQLAPDVADCYQ